MRRKREYYFFTASVECKNKDDQGYIVESASYDKVCGLVLLPMYKRDDIIEQEVTKIIERDLNCMIEFIQVYGLSKM